MATVTANTGSNNWNTNGAWVGGCPVCGESFRAMSRRKKFCSRACAVKAANDRRPTIGTFVSRCRTCGGEYENNSYQSLYCSRRCKGRASDLRRRLKRHGLTVDEYHALLDAQDHKCGICRSSDWGSRLDRPNIDHDHATGRVRGLLCSRCNLGIGMLRDSPVVLAAAASWVGKE